MKRLFLSLIATAIAFFSATQTLMAGNYKSFKVSVYTRAYEVEKMKDLHWLDSTWSIISSQLTVDKIYLETHRDLLIVPDETLEQAKRYFQKRGIEVAGGITYTINESNNFETFAYSDPKDRKKVQEIAVMMDKEQAKITDLLTGEVLKAVAPVIPDNPWFRRNMSTDVSFKMTLPPHSYRAFKY